MIKQLKEKGMSEGDAQRIATRHLQKNNKLKPGTWQMTEVGKSESQLDWNTRKILRESKSRGVPEHHLYVDINGKVRIKPEYSKRRGF